MSNDFNGKVYVLRHGQTDCNRSGLWYCPEESHINDDGRKQAEGIKDVILKINPEKVYCSPFQRCIDTAEAVIGNGSKPGLIIEDCLGERNFKGVEGLDSEGIMKKFGVSMNFSPVTPNIDFIPNIESSSSFHRRIGNCIDQILNDSRDSKKILIVTHGGVMWSIIYQKLNVVPKPRTFLNCALLGLDVEKGRYSPFLSMNMREDWYSDINPSWSSLQL